MSRHAVATYWSNADADNPPWFAVCSCGWQRGPYALERTATIVADAHRRNAADAHY